MTSRRLAALLCAPALATSLLAAAPATAAQASGAPKYASCKVLNKHYKHGVGLRTAKDKVRRPRVDKPVTNFTRNNAVYLANKKLDRDHDGIACERH